MLTQEESHKLREAIERLTYTAARCALDIEYSCSPEERRKAHSERDLALTKVLRMVDDLCSR